MPTCAIVSFRLGLNDGVSIVAATWARIIAELGFDVVTVAGEGPVDRVVAGLGIDSRNQPRPVPGTGGPDATDPRLAGAVAEALADADLVVVENLCTIPLNLPAALAVGEAVSGRPTVFHHHDPPWQRAEWAHVEALPLRGTDGRGDSGPNGPWRHVTINQLTRAQFAERGIDATCIYNGFATDPPPGDRNRTRAALGLGGDQLLVVHPVRAITRKRIDVALELTAQLGGTYWLLGDAEFGFAPELDRLVSAARCEVLRLPATSIDDAYAASDLVVFPSDWEGFGNPPVEAALRGRPAAVGTYPVGRELIELGFSWLDAHDASAVASALADPDPGAIERNRRLAIDLFSEQRVAQELRQLLDGAGWLP